MPHNTVHSAFPPSTLTGSTPPSVDTLGLEADGHTALETVHWAALKRACGIFWGVLPPPPSAQAVEPTPWATGAPATSDADGHPSERRPSAAAVPPPTQRINTLACSGGG